MKRDYNFLERKRLLIYKESFVYHHIVQASLDCIEKPHAHMFWCSHVFIRLSLKKKYNFSIIYLNISLLARSREPINGACSDTAELCVLRIQLYFCRCWFSAFCLQGFNNLIMMSLFVELVNYNGPNEKLVLNFVPKMFDRTRIVLQKLNNVAFFVESFVLIVNCLITRLKAFNCSLIEQVV